MLRVVITGPECTGKTTLAKALAAQLRAPCVPEAARTYVEMKGIAGHDLTRADVDPIARAHIAAEDLARSMNPPVIVLDTDLVSTVAYARHYYGTCPDWIEVEARTRSTGLYFLCAPDIPWVSDGVRDRPENRDAMFEHFRWTLAEFGIEPTVIRGDRNVRMVPAIVPGGTQP